VEQLAGRVQVPGVPRGPDPACWWPGPGCKRFVLVSHDLDMQKYDVDLMLV
jgi:hypothetical protein